MAENKEFKEIKATTLISVIVHGANPFGVKLAQTISGQGSKVIVIDEYNKETKEYVQILKKDKSIDFVAFEGMNELYETLERFDYLFYLQFASFSEEKQYTSKEFLAESDRVDKTLEAAIKHKAKAAVITSLSKNKNFIEITQLEDDKPKPYSDLEIQRYTETVTAEHYDKSNLNVRIIRIGALLGTGFTGFDDADVQRLFEESATKDRLTIIGEGLDNHHVVHAEDAVFGILKLTFNQQTNGEVITLANKKQLTTLSVAYKLLELNAEATHIEFAKDEGNILYQGNYSIAPNAGKYSWVEKYTIEDSFLESLKYQYELANKKWTSDKDSVEKTKDGDKNVVQTVKTPFGRAVDRFVGPFSLFFARNSKAKSSASSLFSIKNLIFFFSILLIFLGLSYFIFTPLFNIVYGGYKASEAAQEAYEEAQNLELTESSESFEEANEYLKMVQTGLERLEWAFNLTGQEELYDNAILLVSAGDYATRGARDMTYALEPMALYFKDFSPALDFDSESPTTSAEYREYLNQMRDRRFQLVKAAESLQYASHLVEQLDTSVFPERIQPYIADLKYNNEELSSAIIPFQETIYFLPELLGVDERQRYLILLQNPAEIRSTGGWLSSYAIVGIEGGQIRQLEVDDIYNIDGQLKVQGKTYEAPASMQRALGLENWTMSLSNWSPDFPEASNDAEFFIKEAGKAYQIDGVLAINTNLLADLLDFWGGIDVEGESEKITSENLHEKIFAIHSEFVPGSERKSQFIADLADATIKKILSDKESYFDLANIFYESLNKKDLLVNLSNSNANRFFATQNWNGSLDSKYKTAPLPVEWNWGANKANLFIEENTHSTIRIISEDRIIYSYTLSLKNNSTSNTYPEGEYKNWHRLYVPEAASITQTSGFSGQSDEYVDSGYKVLGGWFITPTGGTNELKITYELQRIEGEIFPVVVRDNKLLMDIDVFKQPGLFPGKLKVEVLYPDSWAVIDSGSLNQGVNQLSVQLEQEEDFSTSLSWEKE